MNHKTSKKEREESKKKQLRRLSVACADAGATEHGPQMVARSIFLFTNEHGEAWCSEGDIAADLVWQTRTVQTHLAELRAKGLVWWIPYARGLCTLTYDPPHKIPADNRALLFLPTIGTKYGLSLWENDPRVLGRPIRVQEKREAPKVSAPLASAPAASKTAPAASKTTAPLASVPAASKTTAPLASVPAASKTTAPLASVPATSKTTEPAHTFDLDMSLDEIFRGERSRQEPPPANPRVNALRALYPELSYRAAEEQVLDDEYLYLASHYPDPNWRSSAAVERSEARHHAIEREDAERAARGEPRLNSLERARLGLVLRKAGATLPNYIKTRTA